MREYRITRKLLRLILEASKDAYPMEFAAMLRAEGDLIFELVMVPGTISGNSHAVINTHNLPIDFSIVGTIHSHPSPVPRPSEADLSFFANRGLVHIIVAHPYDMRSWRAYDHDGGRISLPVV